MKNCSLKCPPPNEQNILFFKDINHLNLIVQGLSTTKKLNLLIQGYKLNKLKCYFSKKKNKLCAYNDCIELKDNKKCGNCKKKYYCCHKHQKMDWNQRHRFNCNTKN